MKTELPDQNQAGPDRTLGEGRTRGATDGPVQLDPKASAALAQAVLSARLAEKTLPPGRPPDEQRLQLPRKSGSLTRQLAVHSALILVLAGSCWFAAFAGTFSSRSTLQQIAAETELQRDALARLDRQLGLLQAVVGGLKDEADKAAASTLSYRSHLSREVEQVALAVKEPAERIAALEVRLDRMEQQLGVAVARLVTQAAASAEGAAAPGPEASAKPAADTKPAADAKPVATEAKSAVEPKPGDAKPVSLRNEVIDGWVLREVYDGAALIESRNRRLFEVVPGGVIPGVGRVEAIERRSGRWIVLTDKGIIGAIR